MNAIPRFIVAISLAASADAATLTVNSASDDGTGTCTATRCTLRDAVLSSASGGTINFSVPANTPINLTNGELVINKDLTISGPAANELTIQRSAAAGTPLFRVFQITAAANVSLSRLAIANGSDNNSTGSSGGGILNAGTLRLVESTISGGVATEGGCIFNSGALTITASTISGCLATVGGGISNSSGTLKLDSSTISGNRATAGGGMNVQGGTVTITNSTFAGGMATEGAGLYVSGGAVTVSGSTIAGNGASQGGGIGGPFGAPSMVKLTSSIVAQNKNLNGAGPDIFGAVTSQGFNLVGNNASATITATTGDQIGTPAAPIDPKLGPLQDNGGPTMTYALLFGSPAIDRGNSTGLRMDQRGFVRRVDSPTLANSGDGTDIGAYEVQPDQLAGCSEINLVVGNNNDSGAGSLRAVVANACAGSAITFAPTVRGAIDLTSGELSIAKDLTIAGPGANALRVQRSAAAGVASFRVLDFTAAGANATVSGLTIANGNVLGSGGGISNSGTLTLVEVAISGNAATNGGGIFNGSMLTLQGSTVSANSVSSPTTAGSGGGIFNSGGILTVINSTISGNSAVGPAGTSDSGGGIITNVGSVSIYNSTITGNSADMGGGVRNINGGTVFSSNTIIALNTSPNGPDFNGTLTSKGFNIVGLGGGAAFVSLQPSDQVGRTPAQMNLGPLQDNGGPTQTHALLPGSIAIDSGGFVESPSTDQRGLPRPSDVAAIANASGGDGSDIGAFELQAPAAAVVFPVVEFYNASLDHYFITWVADEIAKLDAGTVIKGWSRTGATFATYTTAPPGTSPVCRYYIPPGLGDSHFFGRGTVECNATGQKNPTFVLEDEAFMHMFLPVGGNCPVNTTQVYRVFSNRLDANHRYMTDKAIRQTMTAKGWLAEGDGPDLVVMCAPQ